MKVTLKPYDPEWKISFSKEKELLSAALKGEDLSIEHIGSTSVEGLGAKPVIDILIGLADFSAADAVIPSIEKLNYEYISKYEDVMPYRRFFVKENNKERTHHIHLVQRDTAFWKRHIFFRDYLRANPRVRAEYFLLK